MATMKAVRIHDYGGMETLRYEDAPIPHPGQGEALVRVKAAGVNPIDWKTRAGYLKDTNWHVLPLILGWDCAGVVEEVGSGTTQLKPGDEIYAFMPLSKPGSYAEYAIVTEAEAAPKPESLDFETAAAVPLAALTAWQGLFEIADLKEGQTALIHAAAGGVGHFAVQLAKLKGTRVVGTASGRNRGYLASLGVDEFIDYEKIRFEEVVRDVDVVLDGVGEAVQARSWQVIKPGGFLISLTALTVPDDLHAQEVRHRRMLVHPDPARLRDLASLIDNGMVTPTVSEVLPLSEARRAHERIQTGHTRGKIVLRP